MIRIPVLAAAVALTAFAATPLHPQVTRAVPGDVAHRHEHPDPEHDAAARAAGLVPLRSAQLPAGTREVRYWYDFGLGYPHVLYRLAERGIRVTGEIVFYWPVAEPDAEDGERPGETYADLVRESNRGRCGGFTIVGETEACRGIFTRRPDWRAVLGRAAAAGLWTLPDESALPDDHVITLDGWGMTVELRAGSSYRSYGYDNPQGHRTWPQARQAIAVAQAFGAADSLLHRPDVLRVYRGVTTGAYESEIRLCSGESWGFKESLPSLAERSHVVLPAAGPDARYYVEVLAEATPEWLARRWHSKFPRELQVFGLQAVTPWTGRECR